MLEHEDDLARLMVLEQGKPLAEARVEVQYASSFYEWFGESPAYRSPPGSGSITVSDESVTERLRGVGRPSRLLL
jgi:acyl-CoA reductase-like NAD-dependent aldehyde dehydrogenase